MSAPSLKELKDLKIGFLGCGKISSAVVRGFCGLQIHPKSIIVSKRSEERSLLLLNDFPDIVELSDTNSDIVDRCDMLFIGLLPAVARDVLPKLDFSNKFVISMMAAVNYDEVLSLTNVAPEYCLKIVPLPSVSRRNGPILTYPLNSILSPLLSLVGAVVPCSSEAEMKPMISVAGHISPLFELMRTAQEFLISNGVSESVSRAYVSSFYAGLAQGALDPSSTFAELATEAATAGGLNEQSLRFLKSTDHFNLATQSLEAILHRLKK